MPDNAEESKTASRQSELKKPERKPVLWQTGDPTEPHLIVNNDADADPAAGDPSSEEPDITPRVCLKCHALISDVTHTCAKIPTIATIPRSIKRIPPGTIIGGDYEIVDFIGEGGMSTVYKAKHLLMNRIVAIKLLHQHLLCDKSTVLRFQREAQAAGNLDDPHIIKVHDFGVEADAQPFLVMDYIVGVSLAELVAKNGPLPLRRSIRIFAQVCQGLQKAHGKGIVHRDLKPSNIMLIETPESEKEPKQSKESKESKELKELKELKQSTQSNESDFVKILDFGIAKILPSEGNENLHLTQTGEVFGSPLYMSPEQCMAKELDTRADIYSMGCLIYESIAGKPPLVGANVFETFYKQTHDMPETLSSVRKDLKEAEALDAIILKCMAKKPEDRYQDINELKDALEAVAVEDKGGLFEKWRKQFELDRIKRSARKHTSLDVGLITLVTAFLFTAVVAAGIVSFREGQFLSRQSAIADQQWSQLDLRGQQLFDKGDLDGAHKLFAQSRQLAKDSNRPKLERASINEIIDVERARGNTGIATDLEQKQAERIRSDEKELLSPINQELDRLLAEKTAQASDPSMQKKVQQVYHRANDTVIGYVEGGSTDGPQNVLKKALALVEGRIGEDFKAIGRVLHNLGYIEHMKGNYASAIALYKRALEKEKKFLPPTDALTARTLTVLGRAYMQSESSLVQSEAPLLEALDINRRNFGGSSQQAAWVKINLAQLYLTHGRLDDAKQEIESAIAILESYQESAHGPDEALTAHRLAQAYVIKSLLTKSPTDTIRAMALLESSPDKDYQSLAVALRGRAEQILSTASRKDEVSYRSALSDAYALLVRLNAVSNRLPSRDRYFNQFYAQERMAGILRRQLNMDGAHKMLSEAVASSTRLYGADSLVTAIIQGELAAVLMDSGKAAKAERLLQKCMPALEKVIASPSDFARLPAQQILDNKVNRVLDMISRYTRLLETNGQSDQSAQLKKKWRKAGWMV